MAYSDSNYHTLWAVYFLFYLIGIERNYSFGEVEQRKNKGEKRILYMLQTRTQLYDMVGEQIRREPEGEVEKWR